MRSIQKAFVRPTPSTTAPSPPAVTPPSPSTYSLTHSLTHTQSPNTHFPLFSAPPSSLLPRAFPPTRASYWWTHLATGATLVPLWMNFQKYAHSGKGKAGVEEGGGESQIHTTSISRVIPELKQFFMLQSVIYFCTTSSCSVHFYSSTGEIVFKLFFKLLLLFLLNYDTFWKIQILGNHVFKLA